MSWSDVFPILSDEMVDQFEAEATKAERNELDEWFAVKAVHGARAEATHIVSTSLFWKNIRTNLPSLKVRNRAQVMRANKKNLLRYDPWDHYVAPLLKGAHWISRNHPKAVFRVHLAADMEFLLPDLLDAGCEVHVMATSSIAHNPGAMWRFLAFDGMAGPAGKLITLLDADRGAKPGNAMAQSVETARLGLGWWRVPAWGELNELGNVCYRPILGCHFGGNQRMPMRLLMQALIWTIRKERINPIVTLPGGCGPARVHGSVWPDYGFDEWFLQTAVYPRAAFDGLLSFIPAEAKSRLLPLDIEYAQWANSRSEIVFFGSVEKRRDPPTGSKAPPLTEIIDNPCDIVGYRFGEECGLGMAAIENMRAMRHLGYTVEERVWKRQLIPEEALKNPNQIYYHHWHPESGDRERIWEKSSFGRARHIAFWAYETDCLPPEFARIAPRMKEIWVPSQYCARLFAQYGRPVKVIPHAVETPEGELRPLPFQRGGKPLTVLFLFDAWSRFPRKNPESVIRVFKEAFDPTENVRLIIKAHHLSTREHEYMTRLCGLDHWITVLNEFMPEARLAELFGMADIVLSLQKSEGFGLNLARTLALGIPLVTNSYGGHRDFCKKDNTFLVPYRMEQPAFLNDLIYTSGRWGKPNEKVAVELLRKAADEVRRNSGELTAMRQRGQALMRSSFSFDQLRERIGGALAGLGGSPSHQKTSPRFT